MKKNLIFVFCFAFWLQISAQYIENFHRCANSFQGYWSCEKRNGYELIDISGKNNHGFYKNAKHEYGRKGRQYLNWDANIDFVDSTGQTRTCLNLNGGYAQANGLCYTCDSVGYNKLLKIQVYIKRDSNSYGIIASFGDSLTGNGVLIYNSLDTLISRDSITIKLLKNHVSIITVNAKMVNDNWYYLKLYLAAERVGGFYNKTFDIFLQDESDRFPSSSVHYIPYNESIPNLGWSGFMCLGKNGFTGKVLNKGIYVDDAGIGFIEKGLPAPIVDICYDFGVSTKSLKYNALNLYPNPVSDVLNIESANTILREYSQYEIYALDGRKKQCGSLSNSIYVHELPPGIYSLKIGPFVTKFVKMN